MSGQQIGTFVGGVVGAFFGAPQLGMAIGGLIGGLVDPTKIQGPRIGDGQAQTATDGAPIAWVMGTAVVAGTIAQYSAKRHVQVKVSGGKGGPPAQYQDELFQDFCILVCESCSLRDSVIDTVLMVQQDGQIVYDVRPGTSPDVVASSTKWATNVTFQFGDEAQLPHPTMEAITGVGNTPAYRGAFTAIFTNFNLTSSGNRIPQFLFTVSSAATVVIPDNPLPLEIKSSSSNYGGGTMPPSAVGAVEGFVQTILFDLPTSAFEIDFDNWAFHRFIVQPLYGSEANAFNYIDQGDLASAMSQSGIYDSGWLTLSYFSWDPTSIAWFAAHHVDLPIAVPDTVVRPFLVKAGRMVTGVRVYGFIDFLPGLYTVQPCDAHISVPNPSGHTLVPRDLNYYLDPSDVVYRPPWSPATNQVQATPGSVLLSDIVKRMCKRGALVDAEIDASDLATVDVLGYPIAKQASAADCLAPILAAYFAYGSEYDGRVNFHFYGADVVMEILRDDLLEANAANQDAIIWNPRNQATEYPRRIVATYVDPDQNYTPVNVAAARSSINVVAIGDQQFPIPVTMDANVAQQAVDKALKVAYATLQGKPEYSVPFARSDTYLKLVPGDPIAFQGRRYVVDEITISNGYVKLTTRYDRQSAYTSTVQAVPGNPPPDPGSMFSGPTNLMAMNLPSLRPQDTYGVYLAASSMFNSPSWKGCVVQVSYDGKISWQIATQMILASTMGIVTPATTTPLTVSLNGDINTVTDAQLAAKANAYALVDQFSQNAEIGQFKTVTETTPDTFQLTDVVRGLMGTSINANTPGDQFTMLDNVYFVPIDLSFAGRTLYFRAIGFGESAADAGIISLVYNPRFNRTIGFETVQDGDRITTSSGDFIEVTA
jgi:hypothetical protein